MTLLDAPPHDPVEPSDAEDAAAAPRPRSWFGRFWRGRPEDAAWIRPALLVLLGGTAVLYIWGSSASGYANSFYSAAVQAGNEELEGIPLRFIRRRRTSSRSTRHPALWPGCRSVARVFGVNSWSLLVPQAVEGVARRRFPLF